MPWDVIAPIFIFLTYGVFFVWINKLVTWNDIKKTRLFKYFFKKILSFSNETWDPILKKSTFFRELEKLSLEKSSNSITFSEKLYFLNEKIKKFEEQQNSFLNSIHNESIKEELNKNYKSKITLPKTTISTPQTKPKRIRKATTSTKNKKTKTVKK